MEQGSIVYPLPKRYFDDMLNACVQLKDHYKSSGPARPLYVVTMKRAFLFENGEGAYGEFEAGDRFLLFSGCGEDHDVNNLFNGAFPTPELVKEVAWEGKVFQIGIVPIDEVLRRCMREKFCGIFWEDDRVENEWLLLESFSHVISS